MLVQRCTLDQHRLILPVSITKPVLQNDDFNSSFGSDEYRALVDTGAQRTVVSRSIITKQRLMRIGHMEFAGLHGRKTHTRYLASIGLWVRRIEGKGDTTEFERLERSLFSIEQPFEIVDMDENLNFDLILGLDVLKDFSFNFDAISRTFELIVRS